MDNGVETSRGGRTMLVLVLLISLGALTYIFWGQWQALAIVAGGGLLVVGAMLLVFRAILRVRDARRDEGLREAFGASRKPREVNDPEDIAKLADLQSKFQEGINTYKAAGKNLYSLPWYVLVGEPGSGKTEMLRHSGVPSPLGELPGVGGTINMNWWFTNNAVVLDTAGRIMFQQVEAGKTTEWKAFLELLKRARANCPINGLMLCIPAESLIRDTIDKVEEKAKKIARQFDIIQRTLDIRFPVFVVITKADLVNGFRSFFDQMDPGEQQQILGWSNPTRDLDARFDPDQIDRHLATVRERLLRRRMALLIDPVHTEDPSQRRADQVDDLYAFPDALMTIAPRLRGYLQTIFVVGEWSPKPLFLRGLYFTSSMRQGASLDTELAGALGVPVDSLPEGRVWDEARAYFLRDLFLRKVFPERGLVTRNTRAQGLYRRRKATVLAAGFISVLALLGLTFYGQRQMDQAILARQGFWSRVAGTYIGDPKAWPRTLEEVERGVPGSDVKLRSYAYVSAKPAFADDPKSAPTVREFHEQGIQEVKANIEVPLVFRPIAGLQPNLAANERREAYRRIVDQTILVPLVKAAREKMTRKGEAAPTDVDPVAAQALKQLIRIEAMADGAADVPAAGTTAPNRAIHLDQLFRYVLTGEEYRKYTADATALQTAVDSVYRAGPVEAGWTKFPPAELQAGSDMARNAIKEGINAFAQGTTQGVGEANLANRQSDITELRRSLLAFRDFETAVQTYAEYLPPAPKDVPAYADRTRDWRMKMKQLGDAAKAVDAQVARVKARPGGWPAGKSMLALFVDELRVAIAGGRAAYKELDAEIPTSANNLQWIRDLLAEKAKVLPPTDAPPIDETVRKDFDELETQYLWPSKNPEATALYNLYARAYLDVTDRLPDLTSTAPVGGAATNPADTNLDAQLDAIARASEAKIASIKGSLGQGAAPVIKPVIDTCKNIEERLTAPAVRYQVVLRVLGKLPQTKDAFAKWVADKAKGQGERTLPSLPMTPLYGGGKPFVVNPQYDRTSAAEVLSEGGALARRISRMAPGASTAGAVAGAVGAGSTALPAEPAVDALGLLAIYSQTRASTIDPYASDYIKYWSGLLAAARNVSAPDWATFQAQLPESERAVNDALAQIINAVFEALPSVKDVATPKDQEMIKQEIEGMTRAAAALKPGSGLVQTEGLLTRSARALPAWRALIAKGSAAAAADAVEQAGLQSLYNDYLIPPAPSPGDVASDYWAKLTRTGYELVKKQRKAAPPKQAATLLTEYGRFPVVAPQGAAPALTAAQVKAAADEADVMSKRLGRAQKSLADLKAKPINDKAFVDDFIATFYPTLPKEVDQKKFDRMKAILEACAAEKKTVLVSKADLPTQRLLAKQAGADATIRADVIAKFRLSGQKWVTPAPHPREGDDVGSFELDEKATIQFQMARNIIDEQPLPGGISAAAPWAGIRLLYASRAVPAPTRAEKQDSPGQAANWYVELPTADFPQKGETTSIWVLLTFPRPLPMDLK